jgi:ferrous iron transport protein A
MAEPTSLNDIPKFKSFEITGLEGDPILVSRLREMGFNRGETVELTGRAPFGEPLLISIRGAVVALRKEEAACVKV